VNALVFFLMARAACAEILEGPLWGLAAELSG
jgi:hypothetical protein